MQALIFSAIAGVCGTGLGGIITALLGAKSDKMISALLAFAAGVMTSIVCFGLIPEATELSSLPITILGIVAGVVIVMLLNRAVDIFTDKRQDKLQVHHTHEELYHESCVLCQSNNTTTLLRSGIIMLVAIGLHNIPEGMAIGAGGTHDTELGLLLAVMIALHNIPEGMAISAPLLACGIRKQRVILLTALSGAPTFLGGLIGILLGGISDVAIALSLSVAGGAMLYVVFGEIIPQAIIMTKSRMLTIVTLFGIILGLAVTAMG
ncbi:ZIP family metal transporter [Christensenellaceae bacterium OttesenSCG-928-K19]|nr:ZIP family metal transporter [Christensenellaceae bacterium OttesenSCG-928-K19]